eukprot:g2761.t1
MNSITSILLLTVLGCVCAQQTDIKQQVLAAMDKGGIANTLKRMDEECRNLIKELLGSCIAELYPDYTLDEIQPLLFTTNPFGDFALNLGGFGIGLDDVRLNQSRTLMRNGGCCQLLCQFSRQGCSCGTGNLDGFGRVITNGALVHPPFEFMTSIKGECENEDVFFKYYLRYPGWWGCFEGSNEYLYPMTNCS